MYQDSESLEALVSVKAKMALPFLIASFLAVSVEREEAIRSKAPEEGKASGGVSVLLQGGLWRFRGDFGGYAWWGLKHT